MEYRLIVDSCCELTEDIISYLDAKSVPLVMTIGDKNYVDNEELDVDGFLNDMNNNKSKVLSACPSPQEYLNAYDKDKVNLVITLSSQLSGSFSSASLSKELAKEQGIEVHVFDSMSASAGELIIAYKIKELIESNTEKEELIKQVNSFIDDMKTFFVLENLDNLMKNGRMNKIVVRLATVMQIRPILGSDGQGNIAFFSKVRGTVAAIEKLCDTIGEHCKETKDKMLAITHCNNEVQALRLKSLVEKAYEFKEIVVLKTGGLSSMYANEGGVIIAF